MTALAQLPLEEQIRIAEEPVFIGPARIVVSDLLGNEVFSGMTNGVTLYGGITKPRVCTFCVAVNSEGTDPASYGRRLARYLRRQT